MSVDQNPLGVMVFGFYSLPTSSCVRKNLQTPNGTGRPGPESFMVHAFTIKPGLMRTPSREVQGDAPIVHGFPMEVSERAFLARRPCGHQAAGIGSAQRYRMGHM